MKHIFQILTLSSVFFLSFISFNCDAESTKKIKKYKNGNYYIGRLKKGKREGEGILSYSFGPVYKGEWKNNKKNGVGVYYFSNGDIYEGEWVNNQMCGQGTLFFNNGDKYKGEWKDGKMNGHGTLYLENGDIYKGEWKDGQRNGSGKYIYKDVGQFEGIWLNDQKHGLGTLLYNNGDVYQGKWRNDIRVNLKYKVENSHKASLVSSLNGKTVEIFIAANLDGSDVTQFVQSIQNPENKINQELNGFIKKYKMKGPFNLHVGTNATKEFDEIIKEDNVGIAIWVSHGSIKGKLLTDKDSKTNKCHYLDQKLLSLSTSLKFMMVASCYPNKTGKRCARMNKNVKVFHEDFNHETFDNEIEDNILKFIDYLKNEEKILHDRPSSISPRPLKRVRL